MKKESKIGLKIEYITFSEVQITVVLLQRKCLHMVKNSRWNWRPIVTLNLRQLENADPVVFIVPRGFYQRSEWAKLAKNILNTLFLGHCAMPTAL